MRRTSNMHLQVAERCFASFQYAEGELQAKYRERTCPERGATPVTRLKPLINQHLLKCAIISHLEYNLVGVK